MQTQHANSESDSTRGTQSPEAVVRRLIDVGFSLGRLEVAEELIAEDCLEHQDYGPNHAPGPDGVKAVIASLHRAFPADESTSVAGQPSVGYRTGVPADLVKLPYLMIRRDGGG